MEKLQFTFQVKASTDPKTNIVCVTTIGTPDGRNYKVPTEFQNITEHKELVKNSIVKNIIKTLKVRHQSRKVWIKLTEKLGEYLDDSGNVILSDYYPEEISTEDIEEQPIRSRNEQTNRNLKKITDNFVIEKFSSKNCNAVQWLNTFENECTRLQINKDEERIEVLRLFLEGSVIDWYNSMLIRNTLMSEWNIWKDNFTDTYADKGWSSIRYAILYKYVNGSLLDYALKKERMLLGMNNTIDDCTMINLIAVGLPEFIMDRINRKKLSKPRDLFTELGSLEHLMKKKNTSKNMKNNAEKEQQKRPCTICERKGKPNRYHPESTCWYKAEKDAKDKNQIKCVNNVEIETELFETIPKNL